MGLCSVQLSGSMHSTVGIFIACLRRFISFLVVCVVKKKKKKKNLVQKEDEFSDIQQST